MNQETATPAKKKRKAVSQKVLAVLPDGATQIKVTLNVREKTIRFRKLGSRTVTEAGLREIYDKLTGQIVMPFV